MNKLALALALILPSLAGVAHAAPVMGFVKPTTNDLKQYLQAAKTTPIKSSASHNSQYYKLTQALQHNLGAFKVINLGIGVDFARTAYVPKVDIKGLKSDTAYIKSGVVFGPQFYGKAKLPLF